MEMFLTFIVIVLLIQIAIFFITRKKKKQIGSKDSILEKYNIKTRGDAFKIINSHRVPEPDRLMIEKFYQEGI